jgi:hypothetical protein
MKKIYLAGGCFWGVEHYFSLINGILKHDVGYANSNIANPSYQDVCKGLSTASETVELEYDEELRVWHCEECFVVGKNLESGIKLKLNNIVKNTQTKLSDKYPYYAKYNKC